MCSDETAKLNARHVAGCCGIIDVISGKDTNDASNGVVDRGCREFAARNPVARFRRLCGRRDHIVARGDHDTDIRRYLESDPDLGRDGREIFSLFS